MPHRSTPKPSWLDGNYVSLTTFRRDGTPRPTPVWIVALDDGRMAVFSEPEQWKVKRARATPRVELRPCDIKGRLAPDAPVVTGSVEVSTDPAIFRQVSKRIRAKYPIQGHAMVIGLRVKYALRRNLHPECCLLITLDDQDTDASG